MELEAGMYVRTPKGIGKIETIEEDRSEITFNCDSGLSISFVKRGFTKEEIANTYEHSNNIIDLIRERDFVKVRIDGVFINWFMVDLFEDEDENEMLGIGCYEDGLLNSISEYRPLNTLEILEVLTKEQFESMSYKVGE